MQSILLEGLSAVIAGGLWVDIAGGLEIEAAVRLTLMAGSGLKVLRGFHRWWAALDIADGLTSLMDWDCNRWWAED